ncbi:MAG TPA: methyltransferase domain-containing protein [Thermodesulfobacteriota bacterium]|nr:methyltransferase domain-containing protein [Thermodesulfobacteriota bacterium]
MPSKYTSPKIRYHPLEKINIHRPVDRINYIKEQCKGLNVLDLGAYDETLIGKKQHSSWRWLHSEIAEVAKEVLGVDSSPQIKSLGRLKTPCGSTILYGEVDALEEIISFFKPDLIVAGELMEHTPNSLEWITRLGHLSPGTRLIATTPNATSIINLLLSFIGRENCHEDHLHIYSYKTLATLARKASIEDVKIIPYYYDPHIFIGRFPNWVTPIVQTINYLLAVPLQYFFPLTAFGLIMDGFLGSASE